MWISLVYAFNLPPSFRYIQMVTNLCCYKGVDEIHQNFYPRKNRLKINLPVMGAMFSQQE